jgi:hypothetical protein
MARMKTKLVSLTLAFTVLMSTASFAADAFTGTWKLNEKKSKIASGMSKNRTVTYSNTFPFQDKVTIEGVDAHGKPFRSEWTGRYDGSDYKITGDPAADTRAVKSVDDRTLQFWSKKGGKLVNSGRTTVSADGKTRTVDVTGVSAKGKKFHGHAVYDKA